MAEDYDSDCKPWFDFEPDEEHECKEAAKELHAVVTTLENDQAGRTHDLIKLMSIYENRDLRMESEWNTRLLMSMPMAVRNVAKSIVDTMVAKFVTNESKATFDVDGGDWEATTKAEDLDRFCWGETYRLRLYEQHEMGLRDCAITGDGWVKFYERDDKVAAERVFPVEMRLDPAQCVSGSPRDLYQIRYLNRHQAMAYYREHAEEIEDLPRTTVPYPYPGTSKDIVRIVEAWHLPDDGKGGRYILACNDIPLFTEEWKRDEFPFVRFTWNKSNMGGYGFGLLEELVPLQSELNKLKHKHLRGLHIHGLPRVYMQAGSQLDPEELTNSPVQIWRYTGAKPEVDQSRCVAPELVQEEEAIVSQMWQIAGVNPLQAGTDMPSRMDSRPGLREYAAIADEKHALPSKCWDRGILDGNMHIIAIARQVVERGGKYEALGRAREFTNTIDFKDCNLENNRFEIKLQNTNLLPTTPAGKRLAVKDLADAGAFDEDRQALWNMLAGAPDIDAIIGDKTAGQKLVKKQLYVMIRKKVYQPPDKYQDIQYAMQYATAAIQRLLAQMGDAKPDKEIIQVYNLLDRYCTDCDDIMQAAATAQLQAQQQAQLAQGGMNGGQPPGPSPDGAGGIPPGAPAGIPAPAGPTA